MDGFLPIRPNPEFEEFRKVLQAELERVANELNIPTNLLAKESNYNYESARQDAMWWNSFPWN